MQSNDKQNPLFFAIIVISFLPSSEGIFFFHWKDKLSNGMVVSREKDLK